MTVETGHDRYAHMRYAACGRSGLRLPRLSFGLWQNFGEAADPHLTRALVVRAFDAGVTHFDLANNYGPPPGAAEERFARVLASDLSAHRDELVIATKAGYPMWDGPYGDGGSRKYLLASLDASLRRLGVENVDIFYHHRPDPGTPLEETMTALADAVRRGKALYVGISNYGPADTRRAAAILDGLGVQLLVHQGRYSMFDRIPEQGLLAALDDLGVGMVAFSPLARGLLTDRYLTGSVPADSRAGRGALPPRALAGSTLTRSRALAAIAAERGRTLAQLAIAWLWSRPTVTSVLIGASTLAQLEENLAALDGGELTSDDLAVIDPYAVDGTGH